jgi:autotransporter-associated beta strand protein
LSGAGSIAASSGVIDNGTFDISAASGGISVMSLSGGGGARLGANTLTLVNPSASILLGAISGTGGLTLAAGTETLSGTNTYTGTTTVSGGILTVIGSLAGPVTVAGGKLNGTGTVGAVNITSGTLAPGDAIGTLHVNGNVALGNGTTFAAEISPIVADEMIATGAVTIGSNTTLAITQDAGTYTTHDYTLISAASVSGTFTTVTGGTFTGLNSTIQYSATGVDLILSAPPPPAPVTFLFGTYGQTANQVAAGEAVTASPATGALYTTLGGVVTKNTSAVPATLAQLSGSIHASLRSAMIEDGKIIRDTVINHAIASSDTITVWGAGFGAYGFMDGGNANTDVRHNDSGVIVGADLPVMDGFNVGLGLALTGQAITVPHETASASGTTNHVVGYANWTDGQWVASLGWDYGWGANQVTRQITTFSETDTGHQSNKLGQIFGEVGYRVSSDVMALEPYLDIANVEARTGAFTETGGIAALNGGAKSGSENFSTLGMRATLPVISIEGVSMVPDFNLGWQHAFTRFVSTQTLVFAGTGESFDITGVPLDTDAAAIQARLDFILSPAAMLDVGYDGNVSGRVQDHAVRADLAWRL